MTENNRAEECCFYTFIKNED